jgi:hypothetical protein
MIAAVVPFIGRLHDGAAGRPQLSPFQPLGTNALISMFGFH